MSGTLTQPGNPSSDALGDGATPGATWEQKRINVTFYLHKGTVDNSGSNTISFSRNLRASANVNFVGGSNQSELTLSLYGMTLEHMNQFATLGMRPNEQRADQVLVEAGDDTHGMSTVFSGTITDAYGDFTGLPICAFFVKAHSGGLMAIKPVAPSSYSGLVDVATIMSGIATLGGVTFTNNGVSKKILDPYLPGTAWDQADRCAKAANIDWALINGELSIWPKGQTRTSKMAVISPSTGMVGYPAFVSYGIEVSARFNPSISFGSRVQVESSIQMANGIWQVHTLQHDLESETPGGRWFSHIGCAPVGFYTSTN